MSEPLKQVVDENYSDLPYHNKETEKIQAERAAVEPDPKYTDTGVSYTDDGATHDVAEPEEREVASE